MQGFKIQARATRKLSGIVDSWSLLVSCALALVIFVPAAQAIEVPPNDGFITDVAGILTPQQDGEIERVLTDYRKSTSNEIAILILQSLGGEDIAQAAVSVARDWGVGGEEDDNGVLILIAYEDRSVFIATGYGLEGALPDIVVKGIIDEDLVPNFREAKYYEGIQAAVAALQKHIGGEYTADRYAQESLDDGAWPYVFFVAFLLMQWIAAAMARTKSWWLGGVLGGIAGVLLTVLFGWWLSIPLLVALGLLFDFILSRRGPRSGRGGSWLGGGGFRGGGGGGFGGFGGGSFGGGGASGKW
jgi:uncharacterized protein